jgi:hypothetical protein
LEDLLLDEMQKGRRRHARGECSTEEYARIVKRFNDFILNGIIPEDLKGLGDDMPIADKAI